MMRAQSAVSAQIEIAQPFRRRYNAFAIIEIIREYDRDQTYHT
jgi:hypothetical protein